MLGPIKEPILQITCTHFYKKIDVDTKIDIVCDGIGTGPDTNNRDRDIDIDIDRDANTDISIDIDADVNTTCQVLED